VAADIPHERLATTLAQRTPDVAILSFGSLTSPAELLDPHTAYPDTRLLVLANNPSSAERLQMIGLGATACLAKSTEARNIRHAIYLASRGLHVLPPATTQT
jgi:DNA-binding NarL/FixJ family response regulator